ncbi:retron St85 family RNA-directed DNA polymerase [Photobacterium leiognathi subsp. mandapamensis]|uniref:retron St85 family RNA-directed DNA polymerase n=1 Tax=Photobacterium leiognathi TaxID=553611 RepID=UPI003BF58C64
MNIISAISKLIDKDLGYIFSLSASAPEAYSTFNVRKKNGGFREISQPSKPVKEIQYAIISQLLESLPIHPCATAYQKGKGIKQNALEHVNKEFILKTDFSNFFPSIRPEDLEYYVNKNDVDLSNLEFNILSKFLFKKKANSNKLSLCIGAPSSPIISNIVMYEIDCFLFEYCNGNNIAYTRYADDMTFSSDNFEHLKEVLSVLKNKLIEHEYPRLNLNHNKTRLISKGRSRRVTGVILSNEGKISVGRLKRRRTRTLLHLLKTDKLDEQLTIELHSNLSFIKNIEPEFYELLLEKNGYELFKKLNRLFGAIITKNTDEFGYVKKFGINKDNDNDNDNDYDESMDDDIEF